MIIHQGIMAVNLKASDVHAMNQKKKKKKRKKEKHTTGYGLIGLDIRSKFTNLIGGGQPSRPIYPDRSVVLFSLEVSKVFSVFCFCQGKYLTFSSPGLADLGSQ